MLHAPIIFKSNDELTSFTINDQSSINSNWKVGDPFYISVDAVDGFYSADISYESHPLPNTTGEKSGDLFRRGKSVTLTGTIWSQNLGGLNLASEYLAQMFWETKLRKLLFYPYIGSVQAYMKCRVNNDLSVVQVKPSSFEAKWSWTVGLRADDPIIYKESNDNPFRNWQT